MHVVSRDVVRFEEVRDCLLRFLDHYFRRLLMFFGVIFGFFLLLRILSRMHVDATALACYFNQTAAALSRLST